MLTRPPASSGARIIDPILLTLIEFDATLDEAYSDSVDWTDYPVESGLPISDHATLRPVTLKLTGLVSDTPLRPGVIPTPDLARQAYERLRLLRDLRRLVTIVTGIRVLESMGIEAVDLSRDSRTGQALSLVVSARQIRIVNSVTVPVPPELLKPPVKASQQSEVDVGKQSGQPVREKTAALQLTDKLTGLGDASKVLLAPTPTP